MPKKTKKIKQVDSKKADYKQNLNYNIQKEIKPDKIEPEKIFDGYNNKRSNPKDKKVPKGSHRMPDGSIMKDKDMKKKNKRSNSKY